MAWNCSFRSTFRLFRPPNVTADLLDAFLNGDGLSPDQLLALLPYDTARSAVPGKLPDPKRYRDGRQLFRTVGLLYEDRTAGVPSLKVTELGHAVRRWRPYLTPQNAQVLGRHAAMALSTCQLRNPTRDGSSYGAQVQVFPFAFIWRAMLALEDTISSDELNRAIFKVENEEGLEAAIATIREAREAGDITVMGPETVTEEAKNDRILVWMAWASFGWTLVQDKRAAGGVYAIEPRSRRILQEAAAVRHRHRNFTDEVDYVKFISRSAGLPKDIR